MVFYSLIITRVTHVFKIRDIYPVINKILHSPVENGVSHRFHFKNNSLHFSLNESMLSESQTRGIFPFITNNLFASALIPTLFRCPWRVEKCVCLVVKHC